MRFVSDLASERKYFTKDYLKRLIFHSALISANFLQTQLLSSYVMFAFEDLVESSELFFFLSKNSMRRTKVGIGERNS